MIFCKWLNFIDQRLDKKHPGDSEAETDNGKEAGDNAGNGSSAEDASENPPKKTAAAAAQPPTRINVMDEEGEESPIWNTLAPRSIESDARPSSAPTPSSFPPGEAFRTPFASAQQPPPLNCVSIPENILEILLAGASSSENPELAAWKRNSTLSTSSETEIHRVERKVMDACRSTAVIQAAPTDVWQHTQKVFAICGGSFTSDARAAKALAKLQKFIKKDPSLVRKRSCNMKALVPDGFSLLQAACFAGNIGIVKFLLEFTERKDDDDVDDNDGADADAGGNDGEEFPPAAIFIDIDERNLQGQTALHVASDRGHVEIVTMLTNAYPNALSPNDAIASTDDDDNDNTNDNTNDGDHNPLRTPPPKSKRKPKSKKCSPVPVGTPVGTDAPVDLAGRTPLAYAMTSKHPLAKMNRDALESILFSPGDRSIDGDVTPPKDRCGGGGAILHARPLELEMSSLLYGTAELAGFRIDMEDAMCVHCPLSTDELLPVWSPSNEEYMTSAAAVVGTGLFGVFDGHGDGGFASKYVSRHFGPNLECCTEWREVVLAHAAAAAAPTAPQTTNDDGEEEGKRLLLTKLMVRTCEKIDNDLKSDPKRLVGCGEGGTTASVALVLGRTIAVANVGDSRCVLVRRKKTTVTVTAMTATATASTTTTTAMLTANINTTATAMAAMNITAIEMTEAEIKAVSAGEGTDVDAVDPELVEEGGADSVADPDADAVDDSTPSGPQVEASEEGGEEKPDAAKAVADEGDGGAEDIETIPLSIDHKPNLPFEQSRIIAAGLTVTTDGRVEKGRSIIGVSRAFGDYDFKNQPDLVSFRDQAIVCTPDVTIRRREDESDMFLILACDGVWDVVTNEEAGAFVVRRVEESLAAKKAGSNDDGNDNDDYDGEDDDKARAVVLAKTGDDLLAHCLAKGSRDNMSVVIVALPASGLAVSSASSSTTLAQVPDAARTLF